MLHISYLPFCSFACFETKYGKSFRIHEYISRTELVALNIIHPLDHSCACLRQKSEYRMSFYFCLQRSLCGWKARTFAIFLVHSRWCKGVDRLVTPTSRG